MTLSMKGLLFGCPLGVLKMSIRTPFTTLLSEEEQQTVGRERERAMDRKIEQRTDRQT